MSSHSSFGCVLVVARLIRCSLTLTLTLTLLIVIVVHISLVMRRVVVIVLILVRVGGVLRGRLCVGRLWLLAHLAVRKLVFCKVFAHFVESVDGPESEFGHLHPPIVHRLCVHHHDHQMQTVLFEAGCKTGPCCRRNPRFGPIETLSEQLVCVRPRKFSRLILEVLSRARVVLLNDHFAN